MNEPNIITMTDSYKLGHWAQYPEDTDRVYSYFESRRGARFPYTVFFGLQYILKRYMVGQVVDMAKLKKAHELASHHFGNAGIFNFDGWLHIIKECDGRLPVRIKAVPEGTPVPTGNVLMTVENLDDQTPWLTNALESLLTHVWYPSTVATLSRCVKNTIAYYMDMSSETRAGLQFKLHDFGYRGVSSDESARIGGAAHLVNFMGTDTVPAMELLLDYYNADVTNLAFSVPATEHSVMTSLGVIGETDQVRRCLAAYPKGILSVVADSYDIYNFVENIVGREFHDEILMRDGVFVVRPDSVTPQHSKPEDEMVWILESLWRSFGGETNHKGFRVLDPHIRALWGDGLDHEAIARILLAVTNNNFSVDCIATFGMGGGLLQKVNRDTQRFAFKCSAQHRRGLWHDVWKDPRDASKVSKRGRLALIKTNEGFSTIRVDDMAGAAHGFQDQLVNVFENGVLMQEYTLDQVRQNAAI